MPRRQPLRRDESQAQTREALLVAAGRLFDERGFSATSITDIATEAGFTTGALYSNFSSKEDLFLSLLERQLAVEMAELSEALSREGTVRGRLEVVGAWYATQAGLGFENRRLARQAAEVDRFATIGMAAAETAHDLAAYFAKVRDTELAVAEWLETAVPSGDRNPVWRAHADGGTQSGAVARRRIGELAGSFRRQGDAHDRYRDRDFLPHRA